MAKIPLTIEHGYDPVEQRLIHKAQDDKSLSLWFGENFPQFHSKKREVSQEPYCIKLSHNGIHCVFAIDDQLKQSMTLASHEFNSSLLDKSLIGLSTRIRLLLSTSCLSNNQLHFALDYAGDNALKACYEMGRQHQLRLYFKLCNDKKKGEMYKLAAHLTNEQVATLCREAISESIKRVKIYDSSSQIVEVLILFGLRLFSADKCALKHK